MSRNPTLPSNQASFPQDTCQTQRFKRLKPPQPLTNPPQQPTLPVMAAITVTTTPTLLVCPEPNSIAPTAQETAAAKNNNGGSSPGNVVVYNTGAATLYVGGTTEEATAANGGPVLAGQQGEFSLPAGRNLYASTASGSTTTRVIVL